MLKIRCTDVRQTRHMNSQLTESEKTEFHTPAIPKMTRNCVKHNSVENISQDLVHPNKSDTKASAPALERIKEQSTHTPGSRKSTTKNL